MERPKRRFEITVHVGADTWEDLVAQLNDLMPRIEEKGVQCGSVGGAPSVGYYINVFHDQAITHESYIASIRKWNDTQKVTGI